jgi:hypothetical protein
MRIRSGLVRLTCLLVLSPCTSVQAQFLTPGTLAFADGRVTVGADVSASYGTKDPGFYTYTDYQYSTLRQFRAGLSAQVTASDRFGVLGEIRIENTNQPYARALYLRVSPWASRGLEARIGLVPPTFGAFPSRAYPPDNLLIGYPLGYQYLTSLRPDAVPASADELLQMRGRGWLPSFSLGSASPDNGVPLASALRGDTGVQLHWSNDVVGATGSLTVGTLANPLFRDDNDGRQVAGRFTARPIVGLILGTSASHGQFVSTGAARAAAWMEPEDLTQTAWGADAEYSRDYYLLRFEAILSRWRLPVRDMPLLDGPVRATSLSFEGRYKFMPGLYGAARLDRLGFSSLAGSTGVRSWDAPVTRLEVGGGYSLQRNLLLKGSYQHNTRETAFTPSLNLVAAEVVFWF